MRDLEIFVSGEGLLGLRFVTGSIEDAVLRAYEAQTGDFIVEDGRLVRDDIEEGRIVGPGGAFILPPDRFDPGEGAALFVRTNGPDAASDAAIDRLAGWTVTVNGAEVDIVDLFRKSKILESAQLEGFQRGFVQEHVITLDLGTSLTDGDIVTVSAPGGFLTGETVTIDTTATRSDAVHVNQVGFAPDDPSKVAILSMWLAVDTDRAENAQQFANGVTYSPDTVFYVVDVATGERVFSDTIALLVAAGDPNTYANGGRPAANLANADTWIMDFSEVTREGSYVVEVEGVGISYAFDVAADTWEDLFVTGARGFYHQRSGIALEAEYTDWVRPASLSPEDGQVAYQSTTTILETANGFITGRPEILTFSLLEQNSTGEIVEEAWGGWHDAGDWDRRPQHLSASNQMMELVEQNRAYFEGVDLNIPESGNALPDLLDEALWTVELFQRLQKADGGVPGGIEGGENFKFGEASWANSRPLYVYAPDPWSSALFAGSAARAARLTEPYDAERAAQYLSDAEDALEWAIANWTEPRTDTEENRILDQNLTDARNLAALELYRTIGDARWEAEFLATSSFAAERPEDDPVDYYEHQTDAAYAYLIMDPALQDPAVAARIRADFLALAETTLANYDRQSGFQTSDNPFAPYYYGSTGANPNLAADILVRAHALTGDVRFLADAIDDANYALGMNPDNVSFVSGVGDEQMRELLIGDAEALGGALPPGIVAYGNWDAVGNGRDYWHDTAAPSTYPENPANWPGYESWQGFFDAVPITEFTVDEPMGPSVYLWGYLAQLNAAGPPDVRGGFGSYDVQLGSVATFIDRTTGTTALQLGVGDRYTFVDGVVATVLERDGVIRLVATDPQDAYPWARTTILSDVDDIFAWDRFDTTYDAEGRFLSRTAVADDGVRDAFVFVAGVRSVGVSTDPGDARPWTSIERQFDDTGDPVSAFVVRDDRTTTWINFEDGQRTDTTTTDVGDLGAWNTVYTEYSDGLRTATYLTRDNGDVVTTLFDGGARTSETYFDGSDSRPWETRTTVFDLAGEIIDRTFEYG